MCYGDIRVFAEVKNDFYQTYALWSYRQRKGTYTEFVEYLLQFARTSMNGNRQPAPKKKVDEIIELRKATLLKYYRSIRIKSNTKREFDRLFYYWGYHYLGGTRSDFLVYLLSLAKKAITDNS